MSNNKTHKEGTAYLSKRLIRLLDPAKRIDYVIAFAIGAIVVAS
jgi:hypothetical protein